MSRCWWHGQLQREAAGVRAKSRAAVEAPESQRIPHRILLQVRANPGERQCRVAGADLDTVLCWVSSSVRWHAPTVALSQDRPVHTVLGHEAHAVTGLTTSSPDMWASVRCRQLVQDTPCMHACMQSLSAAMRHLGPGMRHLALHLGMLCHTTVPLPGAGGAAC